MRMLIAMKEKMGGVPTEIVPVRGVVKSEKGADTARKMSFYGRYLQKKLPQVWARN